MVSNDLANNLNHFPRSLSFKFTSNALLSPLIRSLRLLNVGFVRVCTAFMKNMAYLSFKLLSFFAIAFPVLFSQTQCGHYLNADDTPHDMYHDLHLSKDPPLYPTYHKIPKTSFTCANKEWGYHADTEAQCQVYHLCQGKIVQSFLCPNATLFHNQFKTCDQFYNVRCGVDLEDL